MKLRVGILGAGAAGLCAARHCVDAGYDVTVFEQQADVGGTWIYSPHAGSFSGIYDGLVTNLPIEIMSFKHLEFKGDKSFVEHTKVLAYLKEYAKPIRHLIHFNTIVTKVERDEEQWKVSIRGRFSDEYKDAEDYEKTFITHQHHKKETHEFDILFVCNGHYWDPRIPEAANKLKIPWIHSHDYRRPDEFANKNVAVVGAGPSGCDIASQVCRVAKSLHILHNQRYTINGFPSNVTINNYFHDVEEDGKTLVLRNGDKLTDIDVVIFCTGYKYGVPFCHSNIVESKEDGKYMSSLYLHMVNTKFPNSMFFLGLPWFVIPFTCFDYQVQYAIGVLDGTVELPSKEEMDQFEVERLRLLKEREHEPEYFYRLAFQDQWEYFDLLAKLSKKPPVPNVIRKIFDFNLANMIKDKSNFRDYEYRVKNSEEFEYEIKS